MSCGSCLMGHHPSCLHLASQRTHFAQCLIFAFTLMHESSEPTADDAFHLKQFIVPICTPNDSRKGVGQLISVSSLIDWQQNVILAFRGDLWMEVSLVQCMYVLAGGCFTHQFLRLSEPIGKRCSHWYGEPTTYREEPTAHRPDVGEGVIACEAHFLFLSNPNP